MDYRMCLENKRDNSQIEIWMVDENISAKVDNYTVTM